MRVVELFAGVGGFRIGLERAGHKVVWANEWNKYACDTYDKNFPGQIDRRDLTAIPATDIPSHDLICGGFPCQAFSQAGKRQGFNETRGTLFFEILRIARHHRTPYLLLENVKGLLSHDGGETFAVILEALDQCGYDAQWQVLNSKDFGVPQNRERVIIIGHLRSRPRPEVFPFRQDGDVSEPARGEARPAPQVSNALRAHGTGGGGDVEDSYIVQATGVNWPSRGPEPRPDGLAATLKAGESGTKNRILVGYSGHTASPSDGLAKTVKAGTHGVPGGEGLVDEGFRLRRLTPIECERLQGFPDNWTAGVSDTQRYKQMGNAVTTNVIEAVARLLPMEV